MEFSNKEEKQAYYKWFGKLIFKTFQAKLHHDYSYYHCEDHVFYQKFCTDCQLELREQYAKHMQKHLLFLRLSKDNINENENLRYHAYELFLSLVPQPHVKELRNPFWENADYRWKPLLN